MLLLSSQPMLASSVSHHMFGYLWHGLHPNIEMAGTKACSTLGIKYHRLLATPCSKRINHTQQNSPSDLLHSRRKTIVCTAIAAKQKTELSQMGTSVYRSDSRTYKESMHTNQPWKWQCVQDDASRLFSHQEAHIYKMHMCLYLQIQMYS